MLFRSEFAYVAEPSAPPPSHLGIEAWPKETNGEQKLHGEQVRGDPLSLDELRFRLDSLNERIGAVGGSTLSLGQLMACRLYTGAMFTKYNLVLRSVGMEHFRKQMQALCLGNIYPTTIHAINAAVTRLAVISKATTFFRGISNANLPDAFWQTNEHGWRGGIDFAFASCTTTYDLAMQYSAVGSTSCLWEIQPTTFFKPADLKEISMYPFENEFLFPPRTALEVKRDRVQIFNGKSVLVLEVMPCYRF